MALDISFVMRKLEINKKTINKFFLYEDERRQIRKGKVAGIRKGFDNKSKTKRHFDSPLVLNELNGKWNVIDGNHRIEAIKDKLNKDSDFSIVVWCAAYKNLNRSQEREIYSKWNKGTPESATDYLKWHFKTIPYGNLMLKELPVEVYASEKKMGLKMLVGAYLEAKRQKKYQGSYSAGGEKTVADFRDVTPQDIKLIKAFYLDIKEVFGDFYKGNPFYYGTPISGLLRIWYDNRSIPRVKFLKLFRKVFAEKQRLWYDLCKSGGREASKLFYRQAIMALNDASKRTQFKDDNEILSKPLEVA